MLKYIFILLTVTQASNCHQPSGKTKKEIKFHYATSQIWVGGNMGSGKGTNYQFFLSPVDTSYQFDSAWVNGYRLPVKINSELSTTDTLVLDAAAFFADSGPQAPEGNKKKKGPDEALKPCCADSKVVLRYFLNGNKFFISTTELKPLKGIYYE